MSTEDLLRRYDRAQAELDRKHQEIAELNARLEERTKAYEAKDARMARELEAALGAVITLDTKVDELQRQLAESKRQIERERDYRKRFPLMDAKWLDPECHEGCKSLVLKGQLAELKRREEGLRRVRRETAQRLYDALKRHDYGDLTTEHIMTHCSPKAQQTRQALAAFERELNPS